MLPLTPTGRGASAATHRVRHGQGNTVFECLHRDVRLESTFFADRDERMKLVHVNVRNEGFAPRRMRAMAFALTDPARLREQILINAARQFPEGDVQHWWHMPGGAGVRTHFSDDLLWLPYAAAHHIDVAAETLAAQRKPMSHIATELGCSSASAFAAMMTHVVGVPPSTFLSVRDSELRR